MYKNSDELNQIIDTKLPGWPQFKHREVVQSGEVLEFYACDIIECLCAIWGDPDFEGDLIVEPERLYANQNMSIQIYYEMNTGKWWWDTQVMIALIFFCSSCSRISLEKGPGYNSKQEHHDRPNHHFVR